jgi:hypothetical protein
VRTTLTLDDDVAAELKAASRRTGRPFKDVVNDALRLGLACPTDAASHAPFVVKARDLGLQPGLTIDRVAELVERLEGPGRR